MDYKKDIKDNRLVSQAPSNGTTAFGVTISKKCERLATAIYLVTNFLSDTEPMKFRLRALSLELVRDASLVKNGSQMMEANVLEALRVNILETVSLLELAFIAGLVSEMNFAILKREYASLRDTIEVKKSSRESRTDSILGDNFFNTPEPIFADLASSLRGGTTKQSSTRPHSTFPIQHSVQNPKGLSIGQTTTVMSDRNTKGHVSMPPSLRAKPIVFARSEATKQSSTRPHSPFPVQHSVRIESRRARILKLVKDNREVTIKDIATHFVDLSEKTIQRELVSLVESGVLKKFGERRWSRYALA
ncbi:MAG TPA: hypothetical protein DCS23_01040 [Candidatus Yonathbacteria bacterium]|nr:hypothetical protein [Candidatus Yonathbacteria bacterium]